MKKQCIAVFVVGMVVGVLITMICTEPMRKSDNQTELDKVNAYTQEFKKQEISSNYEAGKTKLQEIKPIDIKNAKGEFTEEVLRLAENYLAKYENDEWSGASVVDFTTGIKIGMDRGSITIQGECTPVQTEERIIYSKAKTSYMLGEWDGREMRISNEDTIKLSEGTGEFLLNGHSSIARDNWDLPEDSQELLAEIPMYTYVPGQGTYAIIDKKLVKFLRGEKITLPGEELSWKGFQDIEEQRAKNLDRMMYDNLPRLYYNKIDGKLYLTSGDETCTFSNSESYVYVFDDYNVSRMRYLGRVDFNHQYPGNVNMELLLNESK